MKAARRKKRKQEREKFKFSLENFDRSKPEPKLAHKGKQYRLPRPWHHLRRPRRRHPRVECGRHSPSRRFPEPSRSTIFLPHQVGTRRNQLRQVHWRVYRDHNFVPVHARRSHEPDPFRVGHPSTPVIAFVQVDEQTQPLVVPSH